MAFYPSLGKRISNHRLITSPLTLAALDRRSVNKTLIKQKIGHDLSVCVLNILPKASSLPMLLAINLTKMEI